MPPMRSEDATHGVTRSPRSMRSPRRPMNFALVCRVSFSFRTPFFSLRRFRLMLSLHSAMTFSAVASTAGPPTPPPHGGALGERGCPCAQVSLLHQHGPLTWLRGPSTAGVVPVVFASGRARATVCVSVRGMPKLHGSTAPVECGSAMTAPEL